MLYTAAVMKKGRQCTLKNNNAMPNMRNGFTTQFTPVVTNRPLGVCITLRSERKSTFTWVDTSGYFLSASGEAARGEVY
jgi:hypothetical protein